MGAVNSYLHSLPIPEKDFPYFLLHFSYDQILLAFHNDKIVDIIRKAVLQCWSTGIEEEGTNEHFAYFIKMHGSPFTRGNSVAAMQVKQFLCKMLADLRNIGWKLIASSDLSQKKSRSTLFFQKHLFENKPTPMICLSISSFNALQLVAAPEHLIPIFKDTVEHGYSLGIEEESTFRGDYDIKLKEKPWCSESNETALCGRRVLLEVYRRFDQEGIQFYGTSNFKGTADCLFFMYDDQCPPGQHSYMMISLNGRDKLRLIDCPPIIIESTAAIINEHWSQGLKQQNDLKNGAWEFVFNGSPWWTDEQDAVWSRMFVTMLLQKYLSIGWCIISSLDINRNINDKSVFVFKSCQPTDLWHFCVSLNKEDKIRIINAQSDMVDMIRRDIVQAWPPGIKSEENYFSSHQFTLNGCPWGYSEGNMWLLARCTMCFILSSLMEHGWRVVCSADVSAKYHTHKTSLNTVVQYPLDVHSWFVAYTGNTQPVAT